MTDENETTDFFIPRALAAQIQAAAEMQHREARDILRDAIEQYLHAWRLVTTERSPAEAATRIRQSRQNNAQLDDAMLRDLMTHGRA